jgi:hypothetical protein
MSINKNITKLIILIAAVVLVLAARLWMISAVMAVISIIKYGYWAIALTFVGFAWLLAKQLPALGGVFKQCRAHYTGLLCVLLAGAYFQVHEPREFKVLFDEFGLSGVARNMHFTREPTYPSRAHYFNGRLITLGSGVDKRPFFYSFLVSLAHDFTGYRPQNAFYVNAGLATILLLLIYAFGFRTGGVRLGCLGVFLMAGLPLLAQNATSGGYELTNLVMIMALYFAGSFYYRSPGIQGLNLFVLTAVLLAQARYESILYVLILPVVVICKWRQERRITLTWMAAISPLMLFMPLFSNKVFMSNTGFFQTKPGQSFISLHYLSDNASVAMYYLFNPDYDSTNSTLLSALGVFGIAFFVYLAGQKIKQWLGQPKEDLVLLLIFIVTCITTLIALCIFWGHWDDPMVSRFSLPLQLLMVILTLRVAVEFLKSRPLPKGVVALAGIWIILFAAPTSGRLYATDGIVTAREYAWLFSYLKHKDPSTTLTVAGSSIGPILYNMPSISVDEARLNRWKLKACMDGNPYREIIVLQRFKLDYSSGKYVETGPSMLGDGFKLETIAERVYRPNLVTRISRVVDVDLAKVKAPDGLDAKTFKDEDDFVKVFLSRLP